MPCNQLACLVHQIVVEHALQLYPMMSSPGPFPASIHSTSLPAACVAVTLPLCLVLPSVQLLSSFSAVEKQCSYCLRGGISAYHTWQSRCQTYFSQEQKHWNLQHSSCLSPAWVLLRNLKPSPNCSLSAGQDAQHLRYRLQPPWRVQGKQPLRNRA